MWQEIKKLIEGNKQFKKKFFNNKNTLFYSLVQQGQRPRIMVIACSDSRVDPAMIFNSQPGQLFVIRNMANLVPPCEDVGTYHGTSAALEFGACFLEVEHIIILGHTQCGGIRALMENDHNILSNKSHSFIAKWMDIARPAYEKVVSVHSSSELSDKIILCEQYALINSLCNLQSFPWVQERMKKNKLFLHAWYFNLATGDIHMYDQQKSSWETNS